MNLRKKLFPAPSGLSEEALFWDLDAALHSKALLFKDKCEHTLIGNAVRGP